MKNNQLAFNASFGLLRIENIVSSTCIYCRILTGDKKGGMCCESDTSITFIPNTEDLKVF